MSLHVRVLTLAAAVLVLVGVSSAHASILVGTFGSTSKNEDPAVLQALIDAYNAEMPGNDLPDLLAYIDKINMKGENDNGIDFSGTNLTRNDVKFYVKDGTGTSSTSIFGTTETFTALSNTAEVPNQTPLALSVTSSVLGDFFYYVAKDGNAGYSLWAYVGQALNPVYIDEGYLNASNKNTDVTTDLYSIGNIKDSGLHPGANGLYGYEYDPVNKAVSHISFYSADGGFNNDGNPVPEPATIAIWSMIGFGAIGGAAWRRRRRKAA